MCSFVSGPALGSLTPWMALAALPVLLGCDARRSAADGSTALAEEVADVAEVKEDPVSVEGVARSTLDEVDRRVRRCATRVGDRAAAPLSADRCRGVIYVRSPLMPLSDLGIEEVARAAEDLGVAVDVVDAEELYAWIDETSTGNAGDAGDASIAREASVASELIAAGATLHFPTLVVHREGRLLDPAITGYKTSDAYRTILARRLETPGGEDSKGLDGPGVGDPERAMSDVSHVSDIEVPGAPGAYFRWVPGTDRVAYGIGQEVSLLELSTGRSMAGPGFIDFVPSPDGRFFVSPSASGGGLDFFDAAEVAGDAETGSGAGTEPVFTDPRMRDQYPSVGILRSGRSDAGEPADSRTSPGSRVYRVLTSWYEGVVFRDYRVTYEAAGSGPVVEIRPLGGPVATCANLDVAISLPIMSKDGRELGARDEETGTTKLYGVDDDGRCTERLDLGLPTGKIAFDHDGGRIAFAVPRGVIRDGSNRPSFGLMGRDARVMHGVFVLDRETLTLSRVEGSEEANRLTFPDFVGDGGVIFLLASDGDGSRARFRVVRTGGGR